MNYSCVALVLLVAYLWHAGSLTQELSAVKRLLLATYETIESGFSSFTDEMEQWKSESLRFLKTVHGNTHQLLDLILNNSRKIDGINSKIDTIINRQN